MKQYKKILEIIIYGLITYKVYHNEDLLLYVKFLAKPILNYNQQTMLFK